jgi:hypothetical protein
LHGQEPSDELKRLWNANRTEPWYDFVSFTLVDKLDDQFLRACKDNGQVPQSVPRSFQRTFDHIAFVGCLEDGELVGYWLGPENRSIADAPIVQLDTEGTFDLRGHNLAEYLLSRVFSDEDYDELRSVLGTLGLHVAAETRRDLLKSFNGLDAQFGDPAQLYSQYSDEEKGKNEKKKKKKS